MIVKQHGPDKRKIRALFYTVLLQNYENLQAVYKQDTNSEITSQLAALAYFTYLPSEGLLY